jgi:hypothetical protein
VLAWDYATHHKMLLVDHSFKRTQLIMANQSKAHAITQVVCLWKAKKIQQLMGYLPMSRVYDMCLLQGNKKLLVYHNSERGPLYHSMIDLETKTIIRVLEFKEI